MSDTAEQTSPEAQALQERMADAAAGSRTMKLRVWKTITTGPSKLQNHLNAVEQQGFNVVNVISAGAMTLCIVAVKVEEIEVPGTEDVEPVEDVTSPEAAPPIVDESEVARRQWAAETGGDTGEAGASDVPDEEPKRIITSV